MRDIKDILDTEERTALLVEVFETFIKKAKGYANRPLQGWKVSEQMKREEWLIKQQKAEKLLSDILEDMV